MKIRIFTDGACSGNGKEDAIGGYGAVICLPNKQIKKSGAEANTTNNRMELTAVIKSLEWVLEKYYQKYLDDNIEIEINCDSSYVVNAVSQNWLNFWRRNGFINSKGETVKNKDLWDKFIELSEEMEYVKIPLTFVKVKGHNGIPLNELADRLATSAIKDKTRGM